VIITLEGDFFTPLKKILLLIKTSIIFVYQEPIPLRVPYFLVEMNLGSKMRGKGLIVNSGGLTLSFH
jgi:hypothetical protein